MQSLLDKVICRSNSVTFLCYKKKFNKHSSGLVSNRLLAHTADQHQQLNQHALEWKDQSAAPLMLLVSWDAF